MRVDGQAATDLAPEGYSGPERRAGVGDCDAGRKSWAALQGDQETPGVFEQLRSLHRMMEQGLTTVRVGTLCVVVIAACCVIGLVMR